MVGSSGGVFGPRCLSPEERGGDPCACSSLGVAGEAGRGLTVRASGRRDAGPGACSSLPPRVVAVFSVPGSDDPRPAPGVSMTRRIKGFGIHEATALLNAAGWNVQANVRVRCPVRGVTPVHSVDGTRVLLPLQSGTRVVLDRNEMQVTRPPVRVIEGVRLTSFEPADLRDEDTLIRAAALVRSVGSSKGVLVSQGGHRDTVAVRVDGMTVTEERARIRGPFEVRLEPDPALSVSRLAPGSTLMMALVLAVN